MHPRKNNLKFVMNIKQKFRKNSHCLQDEKNLFPGKKNPLMRFAVSLFACLFVLFFCFLFCYFTLLRVFHINVSRLFLTGV